MVGTVRAALFARTPECLKGSWAMYRVALLAPRMCAAEQLEKILGASGRFALVATTHAGTFLQAASASSLLLIHHELPDGLAIALCQTLASLPGQRPIVIVGVPPDSAIIERYYEFGATSYLLVNDPALTIYANLENALSGIYRTSPSRADQFQSELS